MVTNNPCSDSVEACCLTVSGMLYFSFFRFIKRNSGNAAQGFAEAAVVTL